MMTKMTTQFTFMLCLLFTAANLTAQTPFWVEDFSNDSIPAGWTNEDAATNVDDNGDPVMVIWEHCSLPDSCAPATFLSQDGTPIFGAFNSATADNGYVVVNSDATGELGENHVTSLTTTPIDCSDKSAVFIQFDSHIATFANSPAENAVLRVFTPTSEGETFTLYPDLVEENVTIGSDNPTQVLVDISSVAANSDSVYIQWHWTGNWEWSWALDDINLYDEDPSPGLPEGVLWTETFDGGADGWTFNPIMGDTPWQFTPDGDVTNGAFGGNAPALDSPTQANGAMEVNYDFIQTQGDAGNAPPFPYPDFITELISPIIDVSEANTQLGLEFYQLIRRLNVAPGNSFSSFSISRDGGATWEDPVDANPTLAPNAAAVTGRAYFPLDNVAGEDSLRLKFTYAGDFYFWVVDDVSVIERPLNDMQANENFFAIPSNFMTPISQVEPIYFLADIENVGGEDQTGVELSVTITNESGSEVFTSTEDYGTIAVDSLAENVIFEETYTPMETGLYEGLYEVSADNEDAQPGNNSLDFSFMVTDTTFAKEGGIQGGTAPSDDNSYTYGNVFYVPNGSGWYARYMSFQFSAPEDLAAAGKSITTILYKWDGQNGEDFDLNIEEDLELVAFNSYDFQGDEAGMVTIPVDLDGETYELDDNTYYIPVVQYSTDDDQVAFMGNSRVNDYQANNFLQDSIGMPRFASALDVGNTGSLGLVGFGFNTVPVVRLHIGTNPDLEGPAIVSTQEVLPLENIMEVYPNPTSDKIQLALDLTETSNKVLVKIFDAQGRQVMNQRYEKLRKETFTYNTKSLAAGTYFIQVVTDEGARAQRFVVKR